MEGPRKSLTNISLSLSLSAICVENHSPTTTTTNTNQSFTPSPSDVSSWTANQKLVLLGALQDAPEALAPDRSQRLAAAYGLDPERTRNVELLSAYYLVALRSRDAAAYAGVADLLGRVGRMKYVRPLFRELGKADRELALRTFERNRDFYHPICRAMVEKDLGLAGQE